YLNSEEPVPRGNAILNLASLFGKEAAVPLATKALDDPHHYVRGHAITSLVRLMGKEAVPLAVRFLNDPHYNVRGQAAQELIGLGQNLPDGLEIPEEIVCKLLQTLNEDQDTHIRSVTLRTLTNLCSIQQSLVLREDLEIAFLNASDDSDNFLRSTAAIGLGKFSSERVSRRLVQMVGDSDFSVALSATEALKNMPFPITAKHLPALIELNLTSTESWALDAIFKIQERCKFYNYLLTQPILTIATRLMYILHLSDLHFSTSDQANLWSNQLAADLYSDINISQLDALILSGDIANFSTQEEYKAAEQFLDNLRQDFPLNPEQIILVPGNHDLNWKVTNWEKADDVAYTLKLRRQCKPHELQEGYYIEESANAVWVRDEEKYKQRFAHFSKFYETIKQQPYPLDYDQQYTLDHLPEQNLLILGLNSAWQLDHHYKTRASIHMGALTNALTQIRRNPDYRNSLKIAVWHHPLNSAWEDRITDHGFTEQLAVNGFRLYLHGHIHKAETSPHPYDVTPDGRKLDRICAGTFGARPDELNYGYPWQYNLLKIEDNQLTVYTRRREELNGAWKPDARWGQGAGQEPLSYYAIAL
ncbi:MAG TPA: HEAT repeat domain-containing protein, partial [Chroococcales cyanobacterium]